MQTLYCFPNPFTDRFLISVEDPISYILFDAKEVIIEKGDCAKNCFLGQSLPIGMYLLNLHNTQGSKYLKVVKQ